MSNIVRSVPITRRTQLFVSALAAAHNAMAATGQKHCLEVIKRHPVLSAAAELNHAQWHGSLVDVKKANHELEAILKR